MKTNLNNLNPKKTTVSGKPDMRYDMRYKVNKGKIWKLLTTMVY